MACRLCDAQPWEHKFESEHNNFRSRKWIWKYDLPNLGHFVRALMNWFTGNHMADMFSGEPFLEDLSEPACADIFKEIMGEAKEVCFKTGVKWTSPRIPFN